MRRYFQPRPIWGFITVFPLIASAICYAYIFYAVQKVLLPIALDATIVLPTWFDALSYFMLFVYSLATVTTIATYIYGFANIGITELSNSARVKWAFYFLIAGSFTIPLYHFLHLRKKFQD